MALCKQSMLQLRQKMRIYLRDMHAVYAAAPIDPVIFHVAKEVTYYVTVTCYYSTLCPLIYFGKYSYGCRWMVVLYGF